MPPIHGHGGRSPFLIYNRIMKNNRITEYFEEVETEEEYKESWSEWRYYISNRKLTAQQLLHHVRMEWNVESMHRLLDVHFEEDFCLIESKAVQQHLNMFRKSAINLIKLFKSRTETKRPISNIMLDCLIKPFDILRVIGQN